MTRHLKAAAALLIVLGGLGLSSTLLERRAAAQAKGAVQAPRFEVDPLWPKPLPEQMDPRADHRRVGRCAGSRLDHPSRRLARTRRGPRHDHSADRAVLRAGAADSRVRRRRQSRRPLGRSGPGLRLARLEPRHHGRLQRQRLDRRQRPRITPAAGRGQPVAGQNRRAGRKPGRRACSRSTTTWC